MTPEYSKSIQLNVEEGYTRFLNIVSQGRKMPLAQVDSIAQGRVWDGATAREIGLVDQLGDLDDAIKKAGNLAGLSSYSTILINEESSPNGYHLFTSLGQNTVRWAEKRGLLPLASQYAGTSLPKQIQQIFVQNDPAGIYAHCLLPDSAIAF